LEAFVRRAAVGVWHASCSCCTGASTDPRAVTDNQGRIYGVPSLRIVDASLFPVIPRANVHLTVLMLAEKIADDMLAQHGRRTWRFVGDRASLGAAPYVKPTD
jgi:5-(hydroxymethyl)furfural/furfural oxidase